MCKMAERNLVKHKVEYKTVDAEQADSLVVFYGIKSVPCLIETESLGEQNYRICRTPQSEASLIDFINELKV